MPFVRDLFVLSRVALINHTFFFYPIPQGFTFYDFIINKARGKSGPLFHFDIRADVRLVADVRLEKEDSHPGASYMRC